MVDRYGGRWLMAGGALAVAIGLVALSQVSAFWQFLILRWTLVTVGGVFMCHMVVSVTVSRWFVHKRGRAIAIASLGQGFSKVLIPVVSAALFVSVGWRFTWAFFGAIPLIIVLIPAFIFMRRSPEDIGLKPDGIDEPVVAAIVVPSKHDRQPTVDTYADEAIWTWQEVIRTQTFWIICFIYGMANVCIAGLNLHVFAYVTDIGFSPIVAATVLSIIASTQLGSTARDGSDRFVVRRFFALRYRSGRRLGVARTDLGKLLRPRVARYGARPRHSCHPRVWRRGCAVLWLRADLTGSYRSSFLTFVIALLLSALLSLMVRAPRKRSLTA
jgi:MFS family permease